MPASNDGKPFNPTGDAALRKSDLLEITLNGVQIQSLVGSPTRFGGIVLCATITDRADECLVYLSSSEDSLCVQ